MSKLWQIGGSTHVKWTVCLQTLCSSVTLRETNSVTTINVWILYIILQHASAPYSHHQVKCSQYFFLLMVSSPTLATVCNCGSHTCYLPVSVPVLMPMQKTTCKILKYCCSLVLLHNIDFVIIAEVISSISTYNIIRYTSIIKRIKSWFVIWC
jgi:hypothetical protein